MSRRQRKRRRARPKRNRARTATKGGATQSALEADRGSRRRGRPEGTASKTETSNYSWVTIEHRDPDGNPMIPKGLMASTYQRRYGEVGGDEELKALVLAGYKPKSVMLVERKIYEVHRLSVLGWRRRGQIAVEVDGWRGHEADWFNAMPGIRLQIHDPGLPGPNNEESDYIVSNSSFGRKVVTQVDEEGGAVEVRLYEGTLDITETWKSAWRRQGAEVLNLGIKLLLAPFFVALGVGITLLWLDRPLSSGGDDSNTQEVPVNEGQPTDVGPVRERPDSADSDQPRDVPTQPSGGDEQQPRGDVPNP